MILVDANLLLYAVNADLPQHARARQWWEQVLSGTEAVGIPWVVILAFLRLSTNPRIFERPLSVERAMAYVDQRPRRNPRSMPWRRVLITGRCSAI
ncbi:MAG: TA system VapC family ribonuclease toxin [Arhodomonas sp.]|nr:TA system VapC family ribonuclease toxin [Arhodomonas sp.]